MSVIRDIKKATDELSSCIDRQRLVRHKNLAINAINGLDEQLSILRKQRSSVEGRKRRQVQKLMNECIAEKDAWTAQIKQIDRRLGKI